MVNVFECEFEKSWSFRHLELGTLGPLDSWTSSLLKHLIILFPLHPFTSSYLFLLLSSFDMVWLWGRGVSCDIGDWRLTFDLYIDVKKLWGGWCLLYLRL